MPFYEPDAQTLLEALLQDKKVLASTDYEVLADTEVVVVAIGTPIDGEIPETNIVVDAVKSMLPYLVNCRLLILRSTLYPGTTTQVRDYVDGAGIHVAHCPERLSEGHALEELRSLPQIVGADTPEAAREGAALFSEITPTIEILSSLEAEFSKLMLNSWRYVQFACANEFYEIARGAGLNYDRIRRAASQGYPRAAGLPRAGFVGGACLPKDTVALTHFAKDHFTLGDASIVANEGLPSRLARHLADVYPLEDMTVGILGMSFKPESEDVRHSLSYRLKDMLVESAGSVLCTDPYVDDPMLVPLDVVLRNSDLLVVATPHLAYDDISTDVPIVDMASNRWLSVYEPESREGY
jgi:UDP-N-acetyl-D-mannosaminuronic acid dehydrogenase